MELQREESAKQRALRVDLDHHVKPELLTVVKWCMSVTSLIATIVFVIWACWGHEQGQVQFAPGPVAAVHASFENRCFECHSKNDSLRTDSWNGKLMGAASFRDQKQCLVCHAAPNHHDVGKESAVQVESCSGCHQEHQGHQHSLNRIADIHCTRCHAQLDSLRPNSANKIASLKSGHPLVSHSLPTTDPGKIKFNHALHLRRGLGRTEDGRDRITYARRSKDYLTARVPEWGSGTEEVFVQLACNSCHEPNSDAGRMTDAPLLRQGAYMTPIQYERHCKECHPNTANGTEIPHGLPATDLHGIVLGLVLGDEASRGIERPRGDLLGKDDDLEAIRISKTDASKLDLAKRDLVGEQGCQKCHFGLEASSPFEANVAPSGIPNRWLLHARFDHAAHRGILGQAGAADDACQHCHQVAGSTKNVEVSIPQCEQCVKCHTGTTNQATGVAGRSECVVCHDYHPRSTHPQALKTLTTQ